jgi:phosphoribosylanthranilate isomerase
MVESVGLDAVQLSGDETPEACAEVAAATQLPVIKSLRLRAWEDLDLLGAYVQAGAIPLLDTPTHDGSYGGTGQTGNWELARQAAARWPVILSGGLTPENVADALAAVNPRGVDVSSGVETGGTKDLAKIEMFVTAAREPAQAFST